MEFIYEGLLSITPQQVVMYLVGLLLIYLAIKKEYEPALLLPMGFGAILVNLPLSGVINQTMSGIGEVNGIIEWLFNVGIEASEALPILLFIGIGAMIDFGPLLSQPVMFLFGAAAQFGIFFAICAAALMGFDLKDAASIGIIGALPTAPPPFWFPRFWVPGMSAQLPSPLILTWRWFPLYSPLPSVWSPRKRKDGSACPPNRPDRLQRPPGSFSR